jgi:TonB-dependent receptor
MLTDRLNMRHRMGATVSWTVLGLLLASGTAQAETVPPANDPPSPAAAADVPVLQDDPEEDQEVVLVGTRASQQSANARKKNARTATDSIVADDINSFPDRNLNEAISRVPGVALGRNEFGEGDSISIRGNGPDLTRVELDGVGVQRLDVSLGTGRGADLRELPAEMVKSVDVVKGATADMTEGSLGGSVQIKTRTGLDFSKPYLSLRAGAQQNSLSRDWRPDFSGVAATKLFGDRLGVIISGNYTRVQNNSSTYETTTSNNRGYARVFDFDQSAEKTFAFNPATLGTDAAEVGFANSSQADGTLLTPRELVTLSAGATSKAQCLQLFPHADAAAAVAVRAQRILEQQTCLNQWNDYSPPLIRTLMNEQDEKRYSIDARLDFRMTDNLTIYAKGTIANRLVDDQFRPRSPLTLPALANTANLAGTFVDTTAGYPRVRNVSPTAPAGWYRYDSLLNINNNATLGSIVNINPASVTVDSEHNVTKMTVTNSAVGLDQISNIIDTKSTYAMAGVEWNPGRFLVEAFGGYTKTSGSRFDYRTGRSFTYGDATLTLQPNGLWDVDVPANYDESNPSNYVQLNAPGCITGTNPATCVGQNAVAASPTGPATPQYLVSQMPLTTPNFSVQYSPRAGEAKELIGKLDVTFDTDGLLPFFKRLKAGGQYRKFENTQWTGGSTIVSAAVGTFGQPGYIPAVVTPTSTIRGSLRACQPTAGSSAPGGLSCNYGFVASTNPATSRQGVDTLTPDELRALFASTLKSQGASYFGDLPNRGNLPDAWLEVDIEKLYSALGAKQFMNMDCLKYCTATDGKVYAQPFSGATEVVKNVYGMADFETDLPLGLLLNGNVGIRGVFVDVTGRGIQTINIVQPTAAFNPANPTAPAGMFTQAFSLPVAMRKSTKDWLPSGNLALWAFDRQIVLRLYGSKTVARPTVGNLVPGGTCTISEIDLDAAGDDTFGCTGRVGNPGLKPFTAWSYNAALEWYPNADTLFSVAYGKLDVKIGNPRAVTVATQPFAGSTEVDPITGTPLADLRFNVPTWENGSGYKRDIWEFNVKTAFTFLPWFFRHTGVDANVSLLASSVTTGLADPETGDVMPPAGESRRYINGSIWYDDGKLNLRLTYQNRSESFDCITPCGGNNIDYNYPGVDYTNVALANVAGIGGGYNPGIPRFTSGSTFIDAKASYNITRNFQVYLEGRNITREAQTEGAGEYNKFADGTPRVYRLRYGGRRILVGARLQFGN